MTVVYSLESRSLSTGLAQRTIKNLKFMQRAHENGEDVHIVTQVVNSLLSLLVFPQQKEKAFFGTFERIGLRSPSDLAAVHETVSAFPRSDIVASAPVRAFAKTCRTSLGACETRSPTDELNSPTNLTTSMTLFCV